MGRQRAAGRRRRPSWCRTPCTASWRGCSSQRRCAGRAAGSRGRSDGWWSSSTTSWWRWSWRVSPAAGSRAATGRWAQVRVGSAASYLEDLRGVHVLADAAERRELIVEGLNAAGEWIDPMGKLDEVVHLVEWPVVLEGRFDERYLELPERVPITAMQSHQRYFPIVREGRARRPLRVRRERRRRGGGRGRERGGAGGAAGGCRLRARQGPGPRHRRDAGRAAPRQLPGGGGVAGRQGGAGARDIAAAVRPGRGRAAAARGGGAGGGAVQGRPGVEPGGRVLRPAGVRRVAVRARCG